MEYLITHPIFKQGIILVDSTVHGLHHWQRVERFGLMIAEQNGADKQVISLFAYLHDARRETDFHDIDHGRRAAVLLDELIDADLISLNDLQYQQLKLALCEHCCNDASSDNVTVQTCWDADRLDLWRDNVEPNPNLMFTDYGKSQQMINFAKELNFGI